MFSLSLSPSLSLSLYPYLFILYTGRYNSTDFNEKLDLYFVDSSLMPLMIHENYLSTTGQYSEQVRRSGACAVHSPAQLTGRQRARLKNLDPSLCRMEDISAAADSIALSDFVGRSIMKDQYWELAPLYGALSMIRPCFFVRGSALGMLAFPSLLGKTSTTNKRYRLLRDLQVRFHIPGNI
jgi:replication factor C subunit 1